MFVKVGGTVKIETYEAEGDCEVSCLYTIVDWTLPVLLMDLKGPRDKVALTAIL